MEFGAKQAKFLADVLVAVEQSVLSITARKRIQWVAARALGDGCESGGTAEVRWLLETVLAEAELEVSSDSKLTVPAVKSLLKGAGHDVLASRLSRLSKLRNGASHPDVGLPAAVRKALAAGSEEADGSGSFFPLRKQAECALSASSCPEEKVEMGVQTEAWCWADSRTQTDDSLVQAGTLVPHVQRGGLSQADGEIMSGTKILRHLKDETYDFMEEHRSKDVAKKHSESNGPPSVPFPEKSKAKEVTSRKKIAADAGRGTTTNGGSFLTEADWDSVASCARGQGTWRAALRSEGRKVVASAFGPEVHSEAPEAGPLTAAGGWMRLRRAGKLAQKKATFGRRGFTPCKGEENLKAKEDSCECLERRAKDGAKQLSESLGAPFGPRPEKSEAKEVTDSLEKSAAEADRCAEVGRRGEATASKSHRLGTGERLVQRMLSIKDPTTRREALERVRQLLVKKPDQVPQTLGENYTEVLKELSEIRRVCLEELAGRVLL